MININKKEWNEVSFYDVEQFITKEENERFFFEYKSDSVKNDKVAKEISSFANTFGGYLIIGVDDDGTVGKCTEWNEERVHSVVHDNLSPTPIIDIKNLSSGDKSFIIVRVEEGDRPPYITSKGYIYKRVSSGSYPINDSADLNSLLRKAEYKERKVAAKIEKDDSIIVSTMPSNLCAYVDIGFSLVSNQQLSLEKNFFKLDLKKTVEAIKKVASPCTISRVGNTVLISIGETITSNNSRENMLLNAGIGHFLEVHPDGSAFYRIMISSDAEDMRADITNLTIASSAFREAYSSMIDTDIDEKFVYADKYEKIRVYKQFCPYYGRPKSQGGTDSETFRWFTNHEIHQTKTYGANKVICSSRIPATGYYTVDRELFNKYELMYDRENLINQLFGTSYLNLGYVEPPVLDSEE